MTTAVPSLAPGPLAKLQAGAYRNVEDLFGHLQVRHWVKRVRHWAHRVRHWAQGTATAHMVRHCANRVRHWANWVRLACVFNGGYGKRVRPSCRRGG